MSRLLRRSALAAAAAAGVVAASEILVRIVDPYGVSHFVNMRDYSDLLVTHRPDSKRLFAHRPDVDLDLHGWSVRTNRDGLRGPDRMQPRPATIRRILFVGDSVTFGWGVDEEETFVALIEEALGVPWQTVNAGHLFHDTTQELGVLEETGMGYEPELVLLVFVPNDAVPTSRVFQPLESGSGPPKPAGGVGAWLAHNHALLQFLRLGGRSGPATGGGAAASAPDVVPFAQWPPLLQQGWRQSEAGIRAMRDLSLGRGAAFAVLDTSRLDTLAAFCADEGIPYASIAFSGEEIASGVRNSPADPHANANGHRLYAARILEALRSIQLPGGGKW